MDTAVQLRDIVTAEDRATVMGLRLAPGQDQYLNSMEEIFEEADREQRGCVGVVQRARGRGQRSDRAQQRGAPPRHAVAARARRAALVREKHLTNIRSSTSEVLVRLVPHRQLSLDQALEFLREDECVEVTPHTVRLRKVALDKVSRTKLARKLKAGAAT